LTQPSSWCDCGWPRPEDWQASLCGAGSWLHGQHLWWYDGVCSQCFMGIVL